MEISTKPPSDPAQAVRNFGLDLARASAVVLVLASHTISVLIPAPASVPPAVLALGMAGVELFFSLSGFLIGSILIELARDGVSAGGVARFLGRRWFRTLPMYYAAWLAMSALLGVWNPQDLLFLQNFDARETPVLVVSWSLVLEEWFYLAFPLLMAAAAVIAGRKRIGAGWVLGLALAIIAWCIGVRLAANLGWSPAPFGIPGRIPAERLDCAAYGVLLAALNDAALRACSARRLRRLALFAMLGAPLAAFAWASVAVLSLDPAFRHTTAMAYWGPYYEALRYSGLELIFAVLVFGLAHRLPTGAHAATRTVTTLSRISYSAYLVHVPILTFWTAPMIALLGRAGAGVALVAIALLASCTTYKLIERPFLAVRDSLLAGNGTAMRSRRPALGRPA